MAQTVTHDKPVHRYPVRWIAAIAVAALLVAAVSALPDKTPSQNAVAENTMVDQNFAP